MQTQAAILVAVGQPLVMADLEIPALSRGQVLVDIFYSGVCHTQILEARGYRGEDKFLPHCLGHEGSGCVKEIGPSVTKVKPGDNVILSWIKGAGVDGGGVKYSWNGKTVNAGPLASFVRLAVVSENRMTVISEDVSKPELALFGCAIPTGMGAVMNTAQTKSGQAMAIFGLGGIGISALLAAALTKCHPIIAIDINEKKFDLAKSLGATHVLNPQKGNIVSEIHKICSGGVDVAIEATGNATVMNQAFESVKPQGGTAVLVGNARVGSQLTVNPQQFNMGKRLLGTWGGDNSPDCDFPRYLKLFTDGTLKLSAFTDAIYGLSDVNQAIDDLEAGRVLRPLINMKA